jgi:hypothetical protein
VWKLPPPALTVAAGATDGSRGSKAIVPPSELYAVTAGLLMPR